MLTARIRFSLFTIIFMFTFAKGNRTLFDSFAMLIISLRFMDLLSHNLILANHFARGVVCHSNRKTRHISRLSLMWTSASSGLQVFGVPTKTEVRECVCVFSLMIVLKTL